ncbi:MAG TPA: MarR family transcriptional regulator [Oscillatoriaceae cyanobacterium]
MRPSDEIAAYGALLEKLAQSYKSQMMNVCRVEDLTPPQFFALHAIREHGASKMSPLAEHLGLSMGAASTLIDRLVSRGLVQRVSDPQDRRAVHVSLTEKGQAVLANAQERRRELMRQVFLRLAPESRQQVLRGLGALVEAWESLPTDPCKPS